MTYSLLADGSSTGMKLKIGVMGSASGKLGDKAVERAQLLGKAIAKADCICVTGACPGLPLETAKGAKAAGGLNVGISPGLSLEEHLYKYHSPLEYCDIMIFTGSGLMGREIANIRTCDIVVLVGGRSGTLGEFSIAYDEGKLIGVLTGTGGVADHIDEIEQVISKKTGATIVYNDDPKALVKELLEEYQNRHFKNPSIFTGDYRGT